MEAELIVKFTELVRGLLVQEGPYETWYIAASMKLSDEQAELILDQPKVFSQKDGLWSVIAPTTEDQTADWWSVIPPYMLPVPSED